MQNNYRRMLAPVTVLLMLVAAAAAQQQITPPAPIQVSTTIVTISNSAGKQTDAHVDKDLTAYVNLPDNKIHYYRFSAGVDTAIPLGTAVDDQLPDIGGNRICFTRQGSTGNFDIAVFDVLSSTTSLVDPHPGDLRLGCALGGDTLVFVDFDTGEERGDIFFYDLSANPPPPPQALSLDSAPEQNPTSHQTATLSCGRTAQFPPDTPVKINHCAEASTSDSAARASNSLWLMATRSRTHSLRKLFQP